MKYYPQLKTTTAELKALTNLHHRDHNNLVPILQITKPRITKSDPIDSLDRHIDKAMKSVGRNRTVIIGVTNDETFQDANLNQYILDSSKGYTAWRTRLKIMKNRYTSNTIVPCVVGKPNADILGEYRLQIDELSKEFGCVAVRIPASLDDDFQDFAKVTTLLGLTKLSNNSLILFDFEYVNPSNIQLFKSCLEKLKNAISDVQLNNKCIPLFSSCPSGFPMKERKSLIINDIDMIEYQILKSIDASGVFSYGDYGYVHPTRLEAGGFWYPRIDYPSQKDNRCFYSRYFNKQTNSVNGKLQIRTTTTNEEAYIELSQGTIQSNFYKNDRVESWGRKQLQLNTEKSPITGKSPQHYISIRANIHLEHILSMIR